MTTPNPATLPLGERTFAPRGPNRVGIYQDRVQQGVAIFHPDDSDHYDGEPVYALMRERPKDYRDQRRRYVDCQRCGNHYAGAVSVHADGKHYSRLCGCCTAALGYAGIFTHQKD
jgi:hypothetical protein